MSSGAELQARIARARVVVQNKLEHYASKLDIQRYGEEWEVRFNALKDIQNTLNSLSVKFEDCEGGLQSALAEIFTKETWRVLRIPLDAQLQVGINLVVFI